MYDIIYFSMSSLYSRHPGIPLTPAELDTWMHRKRVCLRPSDIGKHLLEAANIPPMFVIVQECNAMLGEFWRCMWPVEQSDLNGRWWMYLMYGEERWRWNIPPLKTVTNETTIAMTSAHIMYHATVLGQYHVRFDRVVSPTEATNSVFHLQSEKVDTMTRPVHFASPVTSNRPDSSNDSNSAKLVDKLPQTTQEQQPLPRIDPQPT